MTQLRTLAVLLGAFVLGIVTTTLISGCQRVDTPLPVIDSNTTASDSGMPENLSTDPDSPVEPAKDEPKAEAPKADEPKADAPKPDAPKADAPKADAPKADVPKADAPKADAPKADAPKADAPKADAPKADAPKADAPQPGAPQPGEPKADAPKAADGAAASASVGVAAAADRNWVPSIDKTANATITAGDWAQWGGSSYRNNTPLAQNIPTSWTIGKIDRKTGEWDKSSGKNIRWVSRLGSQTYGNPVIAAGRVYVGTNNTGAYLPRYSSDFDLGVLLCVGEKNGEFLWQDSSEKLPTGRVHDWPLQGICCAPYVEGNRAWYVTSRGEVVCLDAEGFHDGEDDGPVQNVLGRLFDVVQNEDPLKDKLVGMVTSLNAGSVSADLAKLFAASGLPLPEQSKVTSETPNKKWSILATVAGAERKIQISVVGAAPNQRMNAFKVISAADKNEADRIWVVDMMSELKVSQHNMCSCSITALGDLLFVNTSNGVDETHINIPQIKAPSFICMDKNTGKVHWTDASPGENVLHGQWSSPALAVLGGIPQVIFGGGDGWLYSFQADLGKDGAPQLLWEFDANPKDTKYSVDARSTRNHIIGTPMIYDGLVYVAVGEDPEHGEGEGHLWCIDPTKRGDVSPQLAVSVADRSTKLPKRRLEAIYPDKGEIAIDNPNSAAVWHFSKYDSNGDGKLTFQETMHRTCGTAAVKNDLLFIADFSGLFHCLDAKSGKLHWTYDMLAASWASPLIVGDKVFITDEDGDVAVFNLTSEPHDPLVETNMENSIYTTPVVANETLFIANRTHLFAIEAAKSGE